MQFKWRLAIPLTLCALTMPALQQGMGESATAKTDRGWSELTSSMEKMHRAMSLVTPSGDTDVDFVRLMLPHHQAAIDMAKSELLLGKSPEMRRLAQEIIADQQSEIDLMQLWLKKHAPGQQKSGQSPDSSIQGD
jgi:uncharacterized protein (DUF305 family)